MLIVDGHLAELVIIRLTLYYFLRDLSDKEQKFIENMLADLQLMQKGETGIVARAMKKGQIISGLRKKLLSSDKKP